MKTMFLSLIAALVALAASSTARAGDEEVHVMVYIQNGIGSSAQAQPEIDNLVALASNANGWAAASGKYVTRQKQADRYIEKHKPGYGIISVGAYLAMRERHGLQIVGTAEVRGAGGRQYHIISKGVTEVSKCTGLASNHASDARFIDKVVAGGAFQLKDFQLKKTRRPVQTLKQVIKGKTDCALIDNAQLAELARLDGGKAVRTIWSSERMPPMAVVTFASTASTARATFKSSLRSLCAGKGRKSCDKVGIIAIKPSGAKPFKAAIAAYDG